MATRTISAAGGVFTATGTWVGGVAPVADDSIVGLSTSGPLTVSAATVALAGMDFSQYTNTITLNNTLLFGMATATGSPGMIKPLGGPVGPGGLPVGPGGSPVGPCGSPVGPGGLPVGPGGSPVGPGGSPVGPGGSPVGPGGSPVGPGGSPVGPGGSPVGPGGSPVGPGGLPVGPGGSPVGPSGFTRTPLRPLTMIGPITLPTIILVDAESAVGS